MLDLLSDESLLESYSEAIKQNLDIEFISILKEEIEERGLSKELIKTPAIDRYNFSLIMD
ncbi:sporulation histidine kinase inhibitor Sda [Alkalihalobacillus deserti]|uniref:sporulation histidine kinase inhibitor Sda n=1 Tax=Alkalihalobacillus deserti TaxID=2879466 RepID=UPI001D148C13|nr:sporulation histidine kinase inhibitor Sda [Alkalihalobacillus deserti]